MLRLALLATAAAGAALAATADDVRQARVMESEGRALEARSVLRTATANDPNNGDAQLAYARFLDRYGDPGAREAYGKALEVGLSAEDSRIAARRFAHLSLQAGDAAAARSALETAGLPAPAAPAGASASDYGVFEIPGLLNSFQRMAALSTDLEPERMLSALARNIVTGGYRSVRGESLEKTEYLKLIEQYLSQAKELEQLAGESREIVIPACESTETAALLKILGYRLRGECGPDAVLETVNPSRAFLSIDSAFPLADLEDAYRRDDGFQLDYRPTSVPVLFGPEYWMKLSNAKNATSFVESFLADPAMARLYVAMAKLHRPTARALKEKIEADKLKNYANVIDFFGASFMIRNGRAVVPGGPGAEKVWADLAGESPANGAEFFFEMAAADDGWLAAYFDALSRTTGAKRAYFTDPVRLERFYSALRGRVTSPGPARPIFRATAELLLLTSRIQFNEQGRPHIPGGIEPWKKLFTEHPHGKYDGKLTRSAEGWATDDDLIEALFGLSRKIIENEPLRMFLDVTNLDMARAEPLDRATIERLMLDYPVFHDQFPILNEVALADQTILYFLDTARAVDKIGRESRRADTAGGFQAVAGLWQILVRQGQIPAGEVDAALTGAIAGGEL